MAKGYKHLSPEEVETIAESYRQTLSVPATAKALGLWRGRVRLAIKKSGLRLTNGRGPCYENVALIRQLAGEGLSFSEIGRRVGSKHQTIAKFVRQHQIPHTPHENKMDRNGRWKGGRMTDKSGYILVRRPDHPDADSHGYIREHRLVMEQELGRRLKRNEVVHHLDGDRSNNSPDNLGLFDTNGKHLASTLADKVPNWTPEGWAGMKAKRGPRATRKQKSSRPKKEHGAEPSPRKSARRRS